VYFPTPPSVLPLRPLYLACTFFFSSVIPFGYVVITKLKTEQVFYRLKLW
jgi:hypothetical protein